MAWKKVTVSLTGTSPYIQHNGTLADPLSPAAKAMKEISSKRKKTDADLEELARREFFGSLYVEDLSGKKRVVIPAHQLIAVIIEGAKKNKMGKQFQGGMRVMDSAPLALKEVGDSIDALWPAFKFTVGVRVGQSRVMRTRPKFDDWGATFTVEYNDELLNKSSLMEALAKAGEEVGVGEWRPRFGRFTVKEM
jgi:hypothetical protein